MPHFEPTVPASDSDATIAPSRQDLTHGRRNGRRNPFPRRGADGQPITPSTDVRRELEETATDEEEERNRRSRHAHPHHRRSGSSLRSSSASSSSSSSSTASAASIDAPTVAGRLYAGRTPADQRAWLAAQEARLRPGVPGFTSYGRLVRRRRSSSLRREAEREAVLERREAERRREWHNGWQARADRAQLRRMRQSVQGRGRDEEGVPWSHEERYALPGHWLQPHGRYQGEIVPDTLPTHSFASPEEALLPPGRHPANWLRINPLPQHNMFGSSAASSRSRPGMGDDGPGSPVPAVRGPLNGGQGNGRPTREELEAMRPPLSLPGSNRPRSASPSSDDSDAFHWQLAGVIRQLRDGQHPLPPRMGGGGSTTRNEGLAERTYPSSGGSSPAFTPIPAVYDSSSEEDDGRLRSLGHSYRRAAIYSQNRSSRYR